MTTLLLLRHGDTDALGKLLAGWQSGWTLNNSGRQQVKALAETLSKSPVRAIYSSPLERAYETADGIATPHGIRPVVREELGEIRFGDWEGRTFDDLAHDPEWLHFNVARSTVRPPNGELLIEVQARMIREANHIRELHEGDTVVIVSHADPIRALLAYYLGSPLDLLSRFTISPASITAIRFLEDDPTILYLNQTTTNSL